MKTTHFRTTTLSTVSVLALMLIASVLIAAEQWNPQVQVVEPVGSSGMVNYGQGLIRATGIGAAPPNAVNKAQARALTMRAAKADAYRNLLETVKGVRVTSETTVENFITKSDVIMTKVDGIVKSAAVVDTKYMSDGSIEVTLEMSLNGDLSHLIIPETVSHTTSTTSSTSTSSTTTTSSSSTTTSSTTTSQSSSGVYTGLIINASGLGARPCMAPRILAPDGSELYGSAHVNQDFAVKQGMVGYVRTLEQAKSNGRVTEPPPPNPIVIKAQAVKGQLKSDIEVSEEDAKKIKSMKNHLSLLQNCRVVFVVG